jgi:hypothetical protein
MLRGGDLYRSRRQSVHRRRRQGVEEELARPGGVIGITEGQRLVSEAWLTRDRSAIRRLLA